MIKTYTSKSNAKRAAKTAGYGPDQIVLNGVEKGGHMKWTWEPKLEVNVNNELILMSTTEATEKKTKKAKAVNFMSELKVGKEAVEPKAKPKMEDPDAYHQHIDQHSDLNGHLRKSMDRGAVADAWALFDFMYKAKGKNLRRSHAIEEAENQGIAYYTARTQYQKWYTARGLSRNAQAKADKEWEAATAVIA